MKRVAFLMQANTNDWLGGVSYFRNLLRAVLSNPDRSIQPVVLVQPAMAEESLAGFPEVEVVRAPLVNHRHLVRQAGRAVFPLIGRDVALEVLLRRHGIDALSHSFALGAKSEIASISWIPDFQHVRMPQYFSKQECRARDKQFLNLAHGSRRVILSSEDARHDFISFAPGATKKARVLRFVSCLDTVEHPLSLEELERRFGIDRPYFHLPNQFWVHKNHAIVVEALAILRKRGLNTLVVATGKTADYRHPQHFERLMARVKDLGLEHSFRPLGVVTVQELWSLMLHAKSLINPSDFEGWSTTVEEAKSFGLPIIVSDIPVHREQAPPLGRYFKTGVAEELAEAMLTTIREHDPDLIASARQEAAADLPERIRQFGRAYEEILMSAIEEDPIHSADSM